MWMLIYIKFFINLFMFSTIFWFPCEFTLFREDIIQSEAENSLRLASNRIN